MTVLLLNSTLFPLKRRKGGEYNEKNWSIRNSGTRFEREQRHRFFGTSWWLSALQVVGGGALVFVAALIFGNA